MIQYGTLRLRHPVNEFVKAFFHGYLGDIIDVESVVPVDPPALTPLGGEVERYPSALVRAFGYLLRAKHQEHDMRDVDTFKVYRLIPGADAPALEVTDYIAMQEALAVCLPFVRGHKAAVTVQITDYNVVRVADAGTLPFDVAPSLADWWCCSFIVNTTVA